MVPEAPLSTAGQAVVDRSAAAMAGGQIMHTAWTSCRPGAVSTMTMPREKILVLQSADELTILFEMPRMVRRVRIWRTRIPQSLQPSYVGDSVGRWEGNTLVVDTLGFNGYAELDARGQPTSAQLHTVERLTLSADGSSIDIEVTITDPEYYDAALHDQAQLEEERRAASVRVRLHGKPAAGRLRERVLRARALSSDLHARGRRRDGAVEGGLPASGRVGPRWARYARCLSALGLRPGSRIGIARGENGPTLLLAELFKVTGGELREIRAVVRGIPKATGAGWPALP